MADDHNVVLDGFISIFEPIENFNVVATANNGMEVLDLLEKVKVDVALLDIDMPLLNGVETCKQMSKKFPEVKVITLSMHREPSFIKRMRQNGAMGYVLKDDNKETLIEAINEVSKGNEYYSDQLKSIVMNHVFKKKTGPSNFITKREKEVLELIAKGLTNKNISEALYVSEHTASSHRKNLLSKFNAKNTADLVRITMEKGLI